MALNRIRPRSLQLALGRSNIISYGSPRSVTLGISWLGQGQGVPGSTPGQTHGIGPRRPSSTSRPLFEYGASKQATSASNYSNPEKDAPRKAYPDFSIKDKVYVITGGGRGLGLVIAEAMVQAGAEVHCLDRLVDLDPEFKASQEWTKQLQHRDAGSLHYHHVDVRASEMLSQTISGIASRKNRLDGLVAAAGVQRIGGALDCTSADVTGVLDINYTGVFMTAQQVAREMIKATSGGSKGGSMVFIASMSGLIANKGMHSAAYNSSKAAVIQLARNLAMEWGKYGIRVNALCPGHIVTPMVMKCFREAPGSKETWERENMLGRLATPDEFTGATIFMLSQASSFMTGSHVVIDGGHTAW